MMGRSVIWVQLDGAAKFLFRSLPIPVVVLDDKCKTEGNAATIYPTSPMPAEQYAQTARDSINWIVVMLSALRRSARN
jgi:hypothetical protein